MNDSPTHHPDHNVAPPKQNHAEGVNPSTITRESIDRRLGIAPAPEIELNWDTTRDDESPIGQSATNAPVQHVEYTGLLASLVAADAATGGSESPIEFDQPYAIIGGPGTGKTRALVEAAARFLRAGGAPEELMVITPDKQSAQAFKAAVMETMLASDDYAGEGSIARSVHAWAYAFLRAMTVQEGRPAPRLLSGAEHDLEIRKFLQGMSEDGGADWPEQVRPALEFPGFAAQLRDFLLRAAERQVSAAELIEWGTQFERPMWESAGKFLRAYQQNVRLERGEDGVETLNASEVLKTALERFRTPQGADLVQTQRERVRVILVDDAHNLDPASAEFITTFFTPGCKVLVAGDPEQSVFRYRGANTDFLTSIARVPGRSVTLGRSWRCGAQTVGAVNSLRSYLPKQQIRVPLRSFAQHEPGATDCALIETATRSTQRLVLVDQVRRAHLEDGVAWGDIAVVVRGTSEIGSLRRLLAEHNVPVTVDSTSLVLAQQPIVRVLLLAVRAAWAPLTPLECRELLMSSVIGVDSIIMRDLHNGVLQWLRATEGRDFGSRVSGTLEQATLAQLTEVINDPNGLDAAKFEGLGASLKPRARGALETTLAIINAGRAAFASIDNAESVLWAVWSKMNIANTLQIRALRGGALGAEADAALDAVMNLFDLAGDFSERNVGSGIQVFVEEIQNHVVPVGTRNRRGVELDAVEITQAHGTVGRQWQRVFILGPQEESWPAGETVGGLFGQSELVDYIDRGIVPGTPISRVADARHEERRLLLVALSRATEKTTLIVANDEATGASLPSIFIEEILQPSPDIDDSRPVEEKEPGAMDFADATAEVIPGIDVTESAATFPLPRVLAMNPLVAELRHTLLDEESSEEDRDVAAQCLAALADAGIDQATPEHWWGMREVSTTKPVLTAENTIQLSPSRLSSYSSTPLTAFFSQYAGEGKGKDPLRRGNLFHALAEAMANGLSLDDAITIAENVVPLILKDEPGRIDSLVKKFRDALEATHLFHDSTANALQEIGADNYRFLTETELETVLGDISILGSEQSFDAVMCGNIDFLTFYYDASIGKWRLGVYDYKTSASSKSKEVVENDLQLQSYQLLLIDKLHEVIGIEATSEIFFDRSALVYPFVDASSYSEVPGKCVNYPEDRDELWEKIRNVAQAVVGPNFDGAVGYSTDEHLRDTAMDILNPAAFQGKQVV